MRTSVAAAGSSAQSRRRCGSGKPSLGADVVRGEPQSQVQIGSSRWYKNACVCECVSERERERVCVCVRGSGACVRKRACQHMRACVSFLSLRACAASRRNCSADRKCGVPAYARRALHASAPSSCNKRGQRCPLCPSASTHVLCSHVARCRPHLCTLHMARSSRTSEGVLHLHVGSELHQLGDDWRMAALRHGNHASATRSCNG